MGERFREPNRSPNDLIEEGYYKFGIKLSDTDLVIKEIERLIKDNFDLQARELKNLSDEYSKSSSKRK